MLLVEINILQYCRNTDTLIQYAYLMHLIIFLAILHMGLSHGVRDWQSTLAGQAAHFPTCGFTP